MSDKIIKNILHNDKIIESPAILKSKRDITEDEIDDVINYTLKEMVDQNYESCDIPSFNLAHSINNERDFIEYVLNQDILNKMAPPGVNWEWDLYQAMFFDVGTTAQTLGKWYIANKCRQSGMSTAFAAKMFARALLTPSGFEGIFVSFKKDEAVNKIKYVRQFLDALPVVFRKKIVRDPLQLIEWENQDGSRARIFSHAQKPVRGTAANVIVLDELAFYNLAHEIYESALPALAQTRGFLEITSTPFGKGGQFFEVFDDRAKYQNFFREWIYWWFCKRYLKDEYKNTPLPILHSEAMSFDKVDPVYATEMRVKKFGNIHLQKFFNTMDIDSFKQEFEGFFVDDQASFFPKDLINSILFKEQEDIISLYNPRDDEFKDSFGNPLSVEDALKDILTPVMKDYRYRNVDFRKYDSFEELVSAVRTGKISQNILAGVDVGATTNSTEITILEEILVGQETIQIERWSKTLQSRPLPEQTTYLKSLLNENIISKLIIDEGGLGKHMSQELQSQYPGVVFGLDFATGGVSKKETVVKNLKARMEKKTIALESNRTTIEQIYSIKRVIGPNGNISYQADERKRHHADKAISICLASIAGTPAINISHAIKIDRPFIQTAVSELNNYNPNRSAHAQLSEHKQVKRNVIKDSRRKHASAANFMDDYFINKWDS